MLPAALSSVGTVLEIKAHKRKEDGRLLVENVGAPGGLWRRALLVWRGVQTLAKLPL